MKYQRVEETQMARNEAMDGNGQAETEEEEEGNEGGREGKALGRQERGRKGEKEALQEGRQCEERYKEMEVEELREAEVKVEKAGQAAGRARDRNR